MVYLDSSVLVACKPAGVLSTDEEGGFPSLLRQELGDPQADLRTVHRLDRAVSGLMVLARNAQAASILSAQVREGSFEKEYLAVVHGKTEASARLVDLLIRDKARKMSFVCDAPAKGVQEARLRYETLWQNEAYSLVRIFLETGRTHQIRVQFASRNLPLVGERKYSTLDDPCPLALFSWRIAFDHPETGRRMDFRLPPPKQWPWSLCEEIDVLLSASRLENTPHAVYNEK